MAYGRTQKIEPPTAEDYALAKDVAKWLTELSEREDHPNDYMHNLATYGKLSVVNAKGVGIVASAIQAYNREKARQAEAANRPAPVSKHIGKVGERLVLKVRLFAVYDSVNDFGVSYIHKFEIVEGPDAGARLTWFGSKRLYTVGEMKEDGTFDDSGVRFDAGMEAWIKGTVKRHGEYKDVKETTLSRADTCLSPEQAQEQKTCIATAKRELTAARKASRKAFGPAKVVGQWNEAEWVPYEQQTGHEMSDIYKATDRPKTRVVQHSDIEWTAELWDEEKSAWKKKETRTDLETAERTAEVGCYELRCRLIRVVG